MSLRMRWSKTLSSRFIIPPSTAPHTRWAPIMSILQWIGCLVAASDIAMAAQRRRKDAHHTKNATFQDSWERHDPHQSTINSPHSCSKAKVRDEGSYQELWLIHMSPQPY